nr:dual specificity protein phosphatase 8 [Loxodonta africana]
MAGDRLPRKVMDAKKLASLLRGGPGGPLVIDSRSFVEYNSWHVLSSVNICCSKLVKRRLQQGKVTIAELVQPASRSQVEAAEPQDVVVYDQSTRDASVLAADSFLSLLLSKLDGCFDSVAILTGGFATFSSCFPGLCEGKPAALLPMSLSQPCLPVPSVGLTRILPHLYLGSQKDVLNKDLMTQNGISYVLNASNSCPKPDFICESHFMRIPVNDNYCEKLLPWLDKSIEFIDKAKLSSCQVIVHCLAGISRSATIAIAYIMKTMGMSSDDAYRFVKDRRPSISPNFNFLGQLLEYERSLKLLATLQDDGAPPPGTPEPLPDPTAPPPPLPPPTSESATTAAREGALGAGGEPPTPAAAPATSMEFVEGTVEGRARGEELAALGKQASFSGSVEVIEYLQGDSGAGLLVGPRNPGGRSHCWPHFLPSLPFLFFMAASIAVAHPEARGPFGPQCQAASPSLHLTGGQPVGRRAGRLVAGRLALGLVKNKWMARAQADEALPSRPAAPPSLLPSPSRRPTPSPGLTRIVLPVTDRHLLCTSPHTERPQGHFCAVSCPSSSSSRISSSTFGPGNATAARYKPGHRSGLNPNHTVQKSHRISLLAGPFRSCKAALPCLSGPGGSSAASPAPGAGPTSDPPPPARPCISAPSCAVVLSFWGSVSGPNCQARARRCESVLGHQRRVGGRELWDHQPVH